jgi:hypothetical protein
MLSANRILYGEYIQADWYKKKVFRTDLYYIKNTNSGEIHPEYPQPLSEVDADNALLALCCFVKVNVSDRVRGKIRKTPEIACEFIRCNRDNFQEQIQIKLAELNIQQRLQNPFIASAEQNPINGQLQGFLRRWAVFTFDEVHTNRGWGMTGARNTIRTTVCYNQDILGVAIRWKTGRNIEIDTMETFRSMYNT